MNRQTIWFSLVFFFWVNSNNACNILDFGVLLSSKAVRLFEGDAKKSNRRGEHSYFCLLGAYSPSAECLFNELLVTRFKLFWLLEFICMYLHCIASCNICSFHDKATSVVFLNEILLFFKVIVEPRSSVLLNKWNYGRNSNADLILFEGWKIVFLICHQYMLHV